MRKRILVFGVFDRLHKGHIYFLKEAKKYGDLTVALARDEVVKKLKNKNPKEKAATRKRKLLKLGLAGKVYLGDKTLGTYKILKKIKPNLIILGYDQDELYKDLKQKLKQKGQKPKLLMIRKSFHPEKYHSRILNKIA